MTDGFLFLSDVKFDREHYLISSELLWKILEFIDDHSTIIIHGEDDKDVKDYEEHNSMYAIVLMSDLIEEINKQNEGNFDSKLEEQ